jgi:hypothetical protein
VKTINASTNVEERHELLTELSDLYADYGDWTDSSLPEELHSLVEQHMRAKAKALSASLRLGRFLLKSATAFERRAQAANTELRIVLPIVAPKSNGSSN